MQQPINNPINNQQPMQPIPNTQYNQPQMPNNLPVNFVFGPQNDNQNM